MVAQLRGLLASFGPGLRGYFNPWPSTRTGTPKSQPNQIYASLKGL